MRKERQKSGKNPEKSYKNATKRWKKDDLKNIVVLKG